MRRRDLRSVFPKSFRQKNSQQSYIIGRACRSSLRDSLAGGTIESLALAASEANALPFSATRVASIAIDHPTDGTWSYICCLPFDCTKARQSGMTLDAGARSLEHNSFQLELPTCLRQIGELAEAPMPGRRTPIRSKGKQKNWGSILYL